MKGDEASNYGKQNYPRCELHGEAIYHDKKQRWYCPFCTQPDMVGDKAPTVYDEDGNPLKIRMVDAECEGDVSGEGHYGFVWNEKAEKESPTIYFERI